MTITGSFTLQAIYVQLMSSLRKSWIWCYDVTACGLWLSGLFVFDNDLQLKIAYVSCLLLIRSRVWAPIMGILALLKYDPTHQWYAPLWSDTKHLNFITRMKSLIKTTDSFLKLPAPVFPYSTRNCQHCQYCLEIIAIFLYTSESIMNIWHANSWSLKKLVIPIGKILF